ncbi:MAG: hypothetical protein WD317_11895 [Balneolaceae bacterium]
MDNKNNNNDSLEQLLKKKAGEYDIPYREEDWLEIEKKLDARDIERTYRKRTALLAAASILIISLLSYFTFDSYTRINQIDRQLSDRLPPAAEQIPDGEELLADRNQPDADEAIGPPGTDEPSGLSDGTDSTVPGTSSANRASSPVTAGPDETGEDPDKGNTVDFYSSDDNLTDTGETHRGEVSIPAVSQVRGDFPDMKMLTVSASAIREEQTPADRAGPDLGKEAYPRISAGLIMSPDLSTVGSISNFYDPGFKIGLTAEYNLTPALSVAAGVIHSKVRYVAHRGDHQPSSYWAGGTMPDRTVGECLLLDIPVTLKFNFLNLSRSRFFTTAGLSSYIMLNEDYQFSYDSYSAGMEQGWSGKTRTAHWMSNAGFSIGYELDVHSNWSLRAEPFVKIPLKGVGWGNVKLYSMGSFVSFNYRF